MADQNLKIQLTAIDKTRQAFSSVRSGLGRVGKSIGNVRTALAALGAGVALKGFSSQIDELAKQSARIGLTVNQLQSLQFAAAQTGAEADTLNKALDRFSRVISETNLGTGIAKRSFDELGITLKNQDGSLKSTNDLLLEVADALQGVPNQADRVRIAYDLLGRSGTNLLNLLQGGSGVLMDLQKSFNAVTMELTGEQAKAVEAANDRFDMLSKVLTSIGQQITAVVLPPLAAFAQFVLTNVLKVINVATLGIRNFLNELVELANFVGVEMQEFTFGEQLNADLERMIANLEKTTEGAEGLARANVGMVHPIEEVAKSTRLSAEEFKKLRDAMVAVPVTYDEIGNKITNLGERSKTAFEQYIEASKDMKSATERMAIDGLGRLEDSFAGMVTGTMSAKDAFRSMANSILSDLARMAAKRALGSLMSGLGGSGGGNPFAAMFGGFRANGGAVSAGKAYIVGEQGAEMFVPNSSGQIIPNGGGGVTVNQTINLSTGVAQTVRTEVMNMMPQIQNAAVSGVLDAKRRGGSFGSAFGV